MKFNLKLLFVIIIIGLLFWLVRLLVGLNDWSVRHQDAEFQNEYEKKIVKKCFEEFKQKKKVYEKFFCDSLQNSGLEKVELKRIVKINNCREFGPKYQGKILSFKYQLKNNDVRNDIEIHVFQKEIIKQLFKKYITHKEHFSENEFIFYDEKNHLENIFDKHDLCYLLHLKIIPLKDNNYCFSFR